jgi:hypothetical protein
LTGAGAPRSRHRIRTIHPRQAAELKKALVERQV